MHNAFTIVGILYDKIYVLYMYHRDKGIEKSYNSLY